MDFKAFFLYACVFLVQLIAAQCYGRQGITQFAPNAYNAANAFNAAGAFNEPDAPSVSCTPSFVTTVVGEDGCPLTITCACALSPNGVSVLSDLDIQGEVSVSGSLPFLSAVSLDGKVPTNGLAAVNYSCGDGNVVITQENGSPCGANAQAARGLSLGNLARVRY